MENLIGTFRQAGRRLAKTPGSSFIAFFAMALGIGLTTSMFSVIQGLYLRGLPFTESHELVHLESTEHSKGRKSFELSQHDFAIVRQEQKSFESIAGYTNGTFNVADRGLPERFDGIWISPGFDETLDVEAHLGRTFRPSDAEPGAPPVVLLSHEVWTQRYGSENGAVGKVVRLNATPTTIIGVMPQGFSFPATAEMWMPLHLRTDLPRGDLDIPSLGVFARLRDGVSLQDAALEMAVIGSQIAEEFPATHAGISFHVEPILEQFVSQDDREMTGVMLAAVILVLLIACFNVANLLIGRASIRNRELAIRSALGSTRWRQISGVFAEAALLAGGGSLLGLGLAHLSLLYFARQIEIINPAFWMEFYLDGTSLAVAFGATVVATLVAGLVPALQASRPDLRSVLSDSNRGTTSFHVGRMSRVMVIAQVALSSALLIAAGLAVRSLVEANFYQHEFERENVLTARVGLFEGTYPDDAARLAFFDDLIRGLGENAEVQAAGLGTTLPTDEQIGSGGRFFARPGETYEDPFQMPWTRFTLVSPGYFEALGVPLLNGRLFTSDDRGEAPAVAVVNEEFARKEWPGENPVGQTVDLWMGDEIETADPQAGLVSVVGVVPNLRFAEFDNEDDQQGIYLPLAQMPVRFTWIVVKTRSAPLAFAESLRREVLAADPDLPLYYVRSMDEVLERSMFFPRLQGVIFSVFGLLAVFLACVGLYGLMAFAVTRRTQEMGIRMALGARSEDVLRMVLTQGLKQTLLGLVFGLVLGGGLSIVLTSFLFRVQAGDPLTFILVPLLLLFVALLACAAPALRASRVEPIVALRHD